MSIEKQSSSPPRHPGDDPDRRRPVLALAAEHPGPHRFPPHRHRRAQLVYASAGVMSVSTGEGTWTVPPGQAVWVPAAVEHAVRAPGRLSLRSLYVHPAAARSLPHACCVVSVPALLHELILKAVTLPPDYPPAGPAARLMAVILDMLEALEVAPLHLPLPRDPRLEPITRALLANPADGRGLAVWARQVGASERTLARRFVADTGLGFAAWRQRLRVLEAVARLGAGETVTRVALDLGYQSPSAFIAMFRRLVGEPPSRYLRAVPTG